MIKLSERVRLAYLQKLEQYGEEVLFRILVGEAVIKLSGAEEFTNPEHLILDHSDEFFKWYRRTGEEGYFIVGRILRRVAHIVYRKLMKENRTSPNYKRFLNVV